MLLSIIHKFDIQLKFGFRKTLQSKVLDFTNRPPKMMSIWYITLRPDVLVSKSQLNDHGRGLAQMLRAVRRIYEDQTWLWTLYVGTP